MALLHWDGFDYYSTLLQVWDQVDSPSLTKISAADARSGGQGVKITQNTGIRKNLGKNVATGVQGFAIKVGVTPDSTPVPFMQFQDSGSNQVEFRVTSAGQIQATRAGTVLGTSNFSIPFTFGVWHYVEGKVTINSSTGIMIFHVDGVEWLNLSSLNTQNTSNAYFNQIAIGWITNNSSIQTMSIDDYYCLDNSGSQNNDFLGDVSIQLLKPTANGSVNNYTQNFGAWPSNTAVAVGYTIKDSNNNIQMVQSILGTGTTNNGAHPTWATNGGSTTVDNAGANQVTWVCIGSGSNPGAANWMAIQDSIPDDDESYLSDANVNDADQYTISPVSSSTGAVKAVCVSARCRKDDAGTRSMRLRVKSSSTTNDNGTDFAQSTSYQTIRAPFETDPNGGIGWTIAAVNAIEVGTKVTA